MRKEWPVFFMDMAYFVSQQSTCLRRKVGAVAVQGKRAVSQGFNGAPSGMTHCLEIGCFRQQHNIPSGQRHELCRAVHAEANVVVHAVNNGISLRGADLFCTTYPCSMCAKLLTPLGIKNLYYNEGYPDDTSAEYLRAADILVIRMTDYETPKF